jgi:hypothetical protein
MKCRYGWQSRGKRIDPTFGRKLRDFYTGGGKVDILTPENFVVRANQSKL